MSEFRTIRELCSVVVDCPHSTPKWTANGKIVIRNNNIKHGRIDFSSPSYTDDEHFAQRIKRAKPQPGDIIITREAPIGDVGMIPENTECCLGQRMVLLRANQSVCDNFYLLYSLQSLYVQHQISWSEGTGTTVSNLRIPHLEQIQIPYLPLEQQAKISSVLRALEEKIENNRRLNDNLEQQAMALYRQMFVENNNDARRECRADEYFDISIGKTPPRKEAQWFSMNPTDCIWVSISDMGRCGMYIADSSEYLTHESVDKFNIKVVPDNTVLLSFKLTVGRVAITDGAMVTNEAIAHFKTDKPEINEYLYCYLKDFNYQTMGSTSSIATAVNSKIIKAMPFVIPTDAELVSFHSATAPMFEMIKTRQRENTRLAELRDSLLPKLMSGEIDVSAVQL
jgi:type I restriction enzyme S subunit